VGTSLAPAFLALGSVRTLRHIQRSGFDFDLIDAHYVYPDGIAAIWLGLLLSKPVVVTARGTDVNLIPQLKIPRKLIQHGLQRASAIIAVSEALKQAIVALNFPANDIFVLRNGVDLAKFFPQAREPIRRDLGLDCPTLISVGHLIERKGHDLIIRALVDLPGYVLLVVGDGPEYRRLRTLATSIGVGARVRFLGVKSHEEMTRYYCAADALVLASSREGWPNVLLEAMACGTPVIASNVWGNPEIVRAPESGLLMNERTSKGVARAVLSLFGNLPARTATRRYAEQYSWHQTSRGQIDIFTKVLGITTPES